MKQWEYIVIKKSSPRFKEGYILKSMGKNGWELVSVIRTHYYFKRKIKKEHLSSE